MTIELCVYNCFCLSSHNACINLDYPKVKNYLNFESMDNVSFIHGVQSTTFYMGLVINKHNDASKARFTLVGNPNG